jgi:hypothetical protein
MKKKFIIRVQRKDDLPGDWGYLSKIDEATLYEESAATFTKEEKAHTKAQEFLDSHPQFGRTRVEPQ